MPSGHHDFETGECMMPPVQKSTARYLAQFAHTHPHRFPINPSLSSSQKIWIRIKIKRRIIPFFLFFSDNKKSMMEGDTLLLEKRGHCFHKQKALYSLWFFLSNQMKEKCLFKTLMKNSLIKLTTFFNYFIKSNYIDYELQYFLVLSILPIRIYIQ